MLIVSIIIIGCLFILTIVLIATEKLNRAVVVLIGSSITYIILILVENANFKIIVDFVVGTPEDNYGNFRSLLLIISMMIIVEICNEAGLFQFIALKLIQYTRGAPPKLLFTFCLLSVILSMVLNNILTVIILIPLTITVSRILSIKPQPYILCEAVLVNIGGTIFVISSIPNILISNYAGIPFTEFFLNVGIFSIIIFFLTLPLFYLLFGNKLEQPKYGIDILLEFNVWNFVPNIGLMTKSSVVFLSLLVGFIVIPPQILPPEILALIAAMVLIVISKLEARAIISKIDIELILYIMGVFVIVGGLEFVGIIAFLGNLLAGISNGDAYVTFLVMLWASAYFSANIDNIPITRALLPIVPIMTKGMTPSDTRLAYYGLAIGANWGDNLTPLGDNVLVMKLAEQNKRPISIKEFFKLGFITANYQLIWATIFISLIMRPLIGVILLLSFGSLFGLMFYILYLKNWKKRPRMDTEVKSIVDEDDD